MQSESYGLFIYLSKNSKKISLSRGNMFEIDYSIHEREGGMVFFRSSHLDLVSIFEQKELVSAWRDSSAYKWNEKSDVAILT